MDGKPSGPAALTYSVEAVEAMIAAVHAAGGRVAAHVTTDAVTQLVRAGVDSASSVSPSTSTAARRRW